jgi:hypothetical protein
LVGLVASVLLHIGATTSGITHPAWLLFLPSTTTLTDRRDFELNLDDHGGVSSVRPSSAADHIHGWVFAPAKAGDAPVASTLSAHSIGGDVAAACPLELCFQLSVKDRTGAPIQGVLITLANGDQLSVTTSDALGRARVLSIDGPTVELHAVIEGYEPLVQVVSVEELRGVHPIQFELTPDCRMSVTVRGARQAALVTERRLAIGEMSAIPGTFGDPVRAVQNLPGVARTPLGLGPVIVRGGRWGDTLTYVDGQEVPLLFHFATLTSVLNPSLLAGLDLYPGPTPAEFGRSIAGAVDVRTRQGRVDRFSGSIDVNPAEAGLFLEGPIGSVGSFMVSARRSYFDLLLPAILDLTGYSNSLEVRVAPAFWDYQLKADFQAGVSDLSVFIFGSDDRTAVFSRNPVDSISLGSGGLTAHVGFQRLVATWALPITPRLSHKFQVGIGRDATDDSLGNDLFLNSTMQSASLRDDASLKVNEELAFAAGAAIVGQRLFLNARSPPPPADSELYNPDLAHAAQRIARTAAAFAPYLWLRAVWRPTLSIRIIPSLRADYDSLLHRAWLDPKLAISIDLFEGVRVKAAMGIAHQRPTLDKLLPVIGNPLLREEGAIESTGGAEWRPSPNTSLSFDVYYRKLFSEAIRNGITAAAVADGSTSLPLVTNTGDGHAFGVELLLRQAPTHGFFGWIAVSLGKSLERATAAASWQPVAFSQRYNITAVASYEVSAGLTVGVRARMVDGYAVSPVLLGVLDSDSEQYVPVNGALSDANRLPNFFQLDVRIEKHWAFARWALNAYLDLENVTNQRNAESLLYNYDFTRKTMLFGLPIFPTLGLKGGF